MKKEWISSHDRRLDAEVVEMASVSRTVAQRLIKNGAVKVNDDVTKKAGAIVKSGDRLSLKEMKQATQETTDIESVDLKLEILHEDTACFVINKPAGLTVHPGAGTENSPTLLSGLKFLFSKKKIPFSSESILVHRLDKDTTGCILVAKNATAHRELQKQFETRTVKKTYLAIVAGVPKKSEALIDAPIGRNVLERTKMSVFKTGRTREAQTQYEVLNSSKDAALLACDLLTGRTHQIRVHLSAIGHPILGDDTYHSPVSEKLSEQVSAMCLHSWKLSFHSPASKEDVSVTAPLPHSMRDALKTFSLSTPQ